jgi:hypothetical protein
MMTLSQLLLPAPADLSARVADALADENVVLQGGGIAFPAGGWRLLPAAVGRHLAGLLDVGILDILVGGWNKSHELGAQLEKSRSSPDKDFFLPLAEHKIASKHHPYLALHKDGQEIGRLPFTVSLELVLQGAVLRIRNGTIHDAESGQIKGKGSIRCGGAIIVEKDLKAISLPGTMPVGLGGGANAPARLARAS